MIGIPAQIYRKYVQQNHRRRLSQPKEGHGQKDTRNFKNTKQTESRKKRNPLPCHIIIKTLNIWNKERILRASKEKGQVIYKGKPIGIIPDFSMKSLKAKRFWMDILQTLRDYGCLPRLLYPAKQLSIMVDGDNKIFYDKTRFKKYLSTNPALQKTREGKLQPKEVSRTHKKADKS